MVLLQKNEFRYPVNSCYFLRKLFLNWKNKFIKSNSLIIANYTFDWDWFVRAKKNGVNFQPVDDFLSIYRIHDDQKTATGGDARIDEITSVYRENCSQAISESYYKLKTSRNVRLYQKFVKGIGLNKFIDTQKLLYRLFFRGIERKITWKEFSQIYQM